MKMGNYFGKLGTSMEEHAAVGLLIDVLDQVIKNKMSNVTRDVKVVKLEYMLDVVRHTSAKTVHVPWQLMVQNTVQAMKECSVSNSFYEIMREMNPSSVSDLVTLYALFVDVVSYRLQNNMPVNTLSELRRLHSYLQYPWNLCVEVSLKHFESV